MTATTVNENGQEKEYGIEHENFITKEEISKRLNKNPRTIRDWMRRGWLPYYKIGRSVRFDWQEVRTHLGRNYRVDNGPARH